ncbi:ATP synthase mitochondrial F1 complex assembly factor 2-like [Saccoglossus kowalevskii]|uniref:ATP synthase mitochondrial F1 complex assembly factor 2-like n=1 Tax=Saccoglossus kowalevskii TaxID=10224 RepID=A0ABM0MP75_SACKO|nr:PREDICTED: ATP synthase mitochondrial F1 complex assembly factor 2-like [Saccoglossus kowalevskii]
MLVRFSAICFRCHSERLAQQVRQCRQMSSFRDIKRFYKNVSVTQNDSIFEINLDNRKLKTPMGNIFTVPNEPLAIAVATEWDSQAKLIQRHTMYLSNLCNAVLDNPAQKNKETIIKTILHYLKTDTVCFREEEPPEFYALQQKEWDPVLEWVNRRYEVNIESTTSLMGPEITQKTQDKFKQHLLSYNSWAIVGYESAVQCLKSLILTAALIDRCISVDQAVDLSRLEFTYQTQRWGRVEWSHDLDEADLKARVAAATLFVHLATESDKVVQKLDKASQ